MKNPLSVKRLVFCLVILAARPVTGSPFRIQFAQRIADYECNMDFKKAYLLLDYQNIERRPFEPSKELKDRCPRVMYSCCTTLEIDALFEGLHQPMADLTKYYLAVRQEFEVMKSLNIKAIKDYYVEFGKKNKAGRCNLDEDDEIFDPFFVRSQLDKVLRKLKKLIKNIVKFYGGFGCSMCDAVDLTNISVNPSTKKMSIKINTNICRQLFKFSQDQYFITELALIGYKLTKALTCRERETSLKLEKILNSFTKRTLKYRETVKFCKIKRTQSNSLIPDCKCQNLCKKLFNFKEWIDYYSILGLVTYNKMVFQDFEKNSDKENLKDISLTNYQNYLEYFIGDDFAENRFQIFAAMVKSIYGESEFEVELDNINGVNPFDHNPRISFKDDKLVM